MVFQPSPSCFLGGNNGQLQIASAFEGFVHGDLIGGLQNGGGGNGHPQPVQLRAQQEERHHADHRGRHSERGHPAPAEDSQQGRRAQRGKQDAERNEHDDHDQRRAATLLRHRVPTPAGDYEGILNAVAELVELTERETGQSGTVGIATPGAISPATGLLKNSNSTVLPDDNGG